MQYPEIIIYRISGAWIS